MTAAPHCIFNPYWTLCIHSMNLGFNMCDWTVLDRCPHLFANFDCRNFPFRIQAVVRGETSTSTLCLFRTICETKKVVSLQDSCPYCIVLVRIIGASLHKMWYEFNNLYSFNPMRGVGLCIGLQR